MKMRFLYPFMIIVLMPTLVLAQVQELPIPDDVKVIGVSLTTILLFFGAFLKNVAFKNDDKRKLIPWILMAAGVVLSAGAGLTFYPDNPQGFAGYVAYGLIAALMASGTHSTVKNTMQFVKKKD
ncbi:hypothetical protein D6827_03545 [Candidatus Parcubacteria bacterium]|nr:MAG: hypothetical protein D6827_03545 [Candidatus Parcubacteria bacterium]